MTKPAIQSNQNATQRVLPAGVHIAASAAFMSEAVVPENESVTTWNMLLPAGDVIECRDGRIYQNPNPQAIVDAYNSDGVDIMIDTNHDSVYSGWDPAAHGWVKNMDFRDGEIWGEIEWTDIGVETLSHKHFRYLSPAFLERPEGTITTLVSLGLVNQPAMTMPAVARSDISQDISNLKSSQKESSVDKKQIEQMRKAYGLGDDATVEEIVAASIAAAPTSKPAEKKDDTPKPEGKKDDTSAADDPQADDSASIDLTKFVPRADYDVVAAERDALKGEADAAPAQAEVEAAVDQAIATARVSPASRSAYIGMCSTQKGFVAFKEFAKTTPKIVAASPDASLNTPATAGAQLSASEISICRNLGISQDKFIANKKSRGA